MHALDSEALTGRDRWYRRYSKGRFAKKVVLGGDKVGPRGQWSWASTTLYHFVYRLNRAAFALQSHLYRLYHPRSGPAAGLPFFPPPASIRCEN
jgi:hypothetical protein